MTDTQVKYRVYRLSCPKCKITGTAILSFVKPVPDNEYKPINMYDFKIQKACYCKLTIEELEDNSTISPDQFLNPIDNKINVEELGNVRIHKGNLQ